VDARSQLSLLRAHLQQQGQSHVLAFWDELSAEQRLSLLAELESVNLREALDPVATPAAAPPPAPARPLPRDPDALRQGEELLARGEVAAVTVAGGQGTRLGFDGPKGAYPVGPVSGHSLFEHFAACLRAAERTYGKPVPWLLMTSFANHAATVALFEANARFGLPAGTVHFMPQGRLPCLTPEGHLVLADKHRLAMAPDGHGGLLQALSGTGLLERMRAQGIRQLSCFQVDNPMLRCIDPVFLGMHARAGADVSTKSIAKVRDDEGLGNFCIAGGKLCVIEYSDFPASLASARNSDGTRTYSAGSISAYALSVDFLAHLVESGTVLPLHRAPKRQRAIDPATGEPRELDVLKLERFFFDVLPLARRTLLVETERDEEFAPVKSLAGNDSGESSKQAMVRRAARWLERHGVRVPRDGRGEPLAVLEISPLLASSCEQLAGRVDPSMLIEPGSRVWLR
jgi:UDP-N-acetylglucosamine/UDP-N-acetylgalactosamine diphosphorylase